MKLIETNLAGWGNCPVEPGRLARPQSLAALRNVVASGDGPSCIARGLGRSYGDAALNREGFVIGMTRLNRFLSFDEETGLLECEAGVSIVEIIQYFLPRGWFVPVTPGTKHVTVGGAIAADVHGKNHHSDGPFGDYVADLLLLTANGDSVRCSPHQRAELFWATVGGMGLTGVIESARIQLRRVESAYVDVTCRRCANLDAALDQLDETETQYRYSAAWVDALSTGKSLGRSVLMLANDAAADQLPIEARNEPLAPRRRKRRNVSFHPPGLALNRWSIKTFNAAYYAMHGDYRDTADFERFFHPLDNIRHWNRLYGKQGFVQYQALFPRETSRPGLTILLKRIAAAKKASFLAVLKSSGPQGQGMLSYMRRGHTLAVDIPFRGASTWSLLRDLDDILLAYGGRLSLANDAHTTADVIAEMYPRLREFQQLKQEIDSQGRFGSSQARRVGIVDGDVCVQSRRTLPRAA